MQYRKLGRTGIEVSEIALGCEGFSGMTAEETKALLGYAFSHGMNFIDLYSSEPELRSHLGQAVHELGIRDCFYFEAHIGSAWENGQYKRTRDVEEAREAFQDLLTRLQTDYIDVGMIHYVDEQADFDTVFHGPFIDYVKNLKAAGKIKAIGMSSHNPLVARQAVETGLIDVLLFSINPAYDIQPPNEDVNELWNDDNYETIDFTMDKDREALYELCEKENVAITVMKCYGGGDLLDEKLSPFKVRLSPMQCISYCLDRPGVKAVMLGIKTRAEADRAVAYERAGKEERDYGGVLSGLPRSNIAGKCVYCGHCAPCTVGIDIASVNKYTNLVKAQKEIPETVREHYALLANHASECIQCGVCETNCPFGVSIIEKMDEAVKIFER